MLACRHSFREVHKRLLVLRYVSAESNSIVDLWAATVLPDQYYKNCYESETGQYTC